MSLDQTKWACWAQVAIGGVLSSRLLLVSTEEGVKSSERGHDQAANQVIDDPSEYVEFVVDLPLGTVIPASTVFHLSVRGKRAAATDAGAKLMLVTDRRSIGNTSIGPFGADETTVTGTITTAGALILDETLTLRITKTTTTWTGDLVLYYQHDDVFVGIDSTTTGSISRSPIVITALSPATGSHASPTPIDGPPDFSLEIENAYADDDIVLTKYADTLKTEAHSAGVSSVQSVGGVDTLTESFSGLSKRRLTFSADTTRKPDALTNTYYVAEIKSGATSIGTADFETRLAAEQPVLSTLNGSEAEPLMVTMAIPQLGWVHSNATADFHRVKVYDAADDSLDYDSGEVSGGAMSGLHDISSGLADGKTYYAIVTIMRGSDGSSWSIDSDPGYFTVDWASTGVKITSHEGTSDTPEIVTDTTPEVTWEFDKDQVAYNISYRDEDTATLHFSSSWVTSAVSAHTLPGGSPLVPGGNYSVQVQVKDDRGNVYSCDKRAWLHVQDASVDAPTLDAAADVDNATPQVLTWTVATPTDGDELTTTVILTRLLGDEAMSRAYENIEGGLLMVGLLPVGSYSWEAYHTDEHGMVGATSAADTFTVTRAAQGGTPDVGEHPLFSPTRPLPSSNEIDLWDGGGNYLGKVNSRVEWTLALEGPDSLGSVSIPKTFLTKHGYSVERPELLQGWTIRYAGAYYTISSVESDLRQEINFTAIGREVDELGRSFSSTQVTPFKRISEIPNEFMNDLLAGSGRIFVENAHLNETSGLYYMGYPAEVNPAEDSLQNYLRHWECYVDNVPDIPHQDIFADANVFVIPDPPRAHVGRRMLGGIPGDIRPEYALDNFHLRLLFYPWQHFSAPPTSTLEFSLDMRMEDDFEVPLDWANTRRESGKPSPIGIGHATGYGWTLWNKLVELGYKLYLTIIWYNEVSPVYASKTTVPYYVADLQRGPILGYDDYDITELVTRDWETYTFANIVPKAAYFRPAWSTVCYSAIYDDYHAYRLTLPEIEPNRGWGGPHIRFDNLQLSGTNINPDTGWRYYGNMYSRDTDVLTNDGTTGWVEFRNWTADETGRWCDIEGATLCRIMTSSLIHVYFGAGGAGAKADILLDNEPVVLGLDVSAETDYLMDDLDVTREHILTIRVNAGKVVVQKIVQDEWNRITVNWSDMSCYECVNALVQAVGGEVRFDTANRKIYHQPEIGEDLEAGGIIRLDEAQNLGSLKLRAARTTIVNRLTLLCYGEGKHRLRVTCDATGTMTIDGVEKTSIEYYGIRCGTRSRPDIDDPYVAKLTCQRMVEDLCWPRVNYQAGDVPDEAAAYLSPGDRVRTLFGSMDEQLRVRAITRVNDGSPAKVVVGDRVGDIADTIADVTVDIDQLMRA